MYEFFLNISEVISVWVFSHLPTVILIIGGAYLAHYFLRRVIERVIRQLIRQGGQSKQAEEKRENTLIQVLNGSTFIIILLISGMMVLSEFGLAIGPLLAAAGVAGLALGFGGQYLIRDLISGTFIILENQYRTGDVVCFDKTCGLVEHITLRMTTLRDQSGTVHHIPHGEVTKVSNMTKGYSKVNLDVGVAYESDLEQVISVVNKVGLEMFEDDYWKEHILKAPQFLRVNDFADSAVMIKIVGETMPIKQWEVTGELRKRLKIAFDREGIVIPYPQRVIHQGK